MSDAFLALVNVSKVRYSIDVLKGVQSLLHFFGHTPVFQDLSTRLSSDLEQLSNDLDAAGLDNYNAADKPGEDHGVIAAWHLEKLLEKAAKDDKSKLLVACDYLPAIEAIAKHNSRKHKVAFDDSPLAFLLILCDTLQEWNRPRLDFATSPTQILSRMVDPGGGQDRWDGLLDKVSVEVQRDRRSPGQFKINGGGTLSFKLKFNDHIRWNAGVFNLWLDASCNLQRLDFKGLPKPFNVRISYETPLFYKAAGSPAEEQFYRLRDATHETHMTFLDRWFPHEPKKGGGVTNGAVTWQPGKSSGVVPAMETLTLDLKELSKMKPISGGMDDFRARLTKWKRYNEDREFGGDYGVPETVL
jgi:hypothetical protein